MRFDEMFKEMQKDKIDASFISSPKYDGVYRWYKTTEQLPPVGCYVLGYVNPIYDEDGEPFSFPTNPFIAIVKMGENGFFTSTMQTDYDFTEITHWMHLPNAPKQEETE